MNTERYAQLIKDWPPEMGMIVGERHEDGSREFGWIGGPVVQLTREGLFHMGGTFFTIDRKYMLIGPYRLRVLATNEIGMDILAVKDKPQAFHDWLLVFKFRLKRWSKSLNRKVLMTLVVWEVLHTEPGAVPEWRDLFRRKKSGDEEEVTDHR